MLISLAVDFDGIDPGLVAEGDVDTARDVCRELIDAIHDYAVSVGDVYEDVADQGAPVAYPWRFASPAAKAEFDAVISEVFADTAADDAVFVPHMLYLLDVYRSLVRVGGLWSHRLGSTVEGLNRRPVVWKSNTAATTTGTTLVLAAVKVRSGEVTADPTAAPTIVLVAPNAPPRLLAQHSSEAST